MDDSAREQQLTQATQAHQQGNFAVAEKIYRELLDQQTDDNIGYLLGTLLLQQGDAKQAIEYLKPVAERNSHSADLMNNLGVAYQSIDEKQQAIKSFQAALKADQNYPQAWQNLGKLLYDLGHVDNAEKCYREAVRLLPEDVTCRQDWAQALVTTQHWEEAAEEIQKIVKLIASNQAATQEWKQQLAYVLAQLHRYQEAAEQTEELLKNQPDNVSLLSNLSYLYEHLGQIDQAIKTSEKAASLSPENPEIQNNLGVAYRSAHRMQDAISAFEKSLSLNENQPLARFNRGSTLLLQERYLEGWADYEIRQQLIPSGVDVSSLPRWNGEVIAGKKLLVICDQGFGDLLMFARFLPMIRERSQAVTVLYTPPEMMKLLNHTLFQGLPLADQFISEEQPLPEADCYFPLLSSGQQFNFSVNDIGMTAPYLEAPASQIGDRLLPSSEGIQKTIGLCWRGNAAQSQDHIRSMTLEQLHPLSEIEGIRWVSLQIDATEDEISSWPGEIHSTGKYLHDFAETAALMQKLDLVITVDTAVAHLAGALNKPVWTLLAHLPDWRWHLQREDSPWYPSMRLFRQPGWGDWESVVNQIKEPLQNQ